MAELEFDLASDHLRVERGTIERPIIGKHNKMPTYEYKCEKCGHEEEFFMSISDAMQTKHRDCGACHEKLAMERKCSGGHVVRYAGTKATKPRDPGDER